MAKTLTGGCQCGRIRYRATLESGDAYLCHCRMCQRATGGFAAAFVNLPKAAVLWSHAPDWHQSSPIARRPFCAQCGSPLGFAFNDGETMLGSFDDPSGFRPVGHFGVEGLHEAWLDTSALPRKCSAETESVASRWQAAGLDVP